MTNRFNVLRAKHDQKSVSKDYNVIVSQTVQKKGCENYFVVFFFRVKTDFLVCVDVVVVSVGKRYLDRGPRYVPILFRMVRIL